MENDFKEKKAFNSSFKEFNESKLNEITIIYNIKNKFAIRLFGKKFVQNNFYNCKIIINNKEQNICEYYKINKNIDKNILKIKLKEIKSITDFSHMFGDDMNKGCRELISIQGIDNWHNTINIINISYIFYNCESLKKFPDISKWDTSNITDMSYMFSGCKSLESLPDISKWDMSNVKNLSYMFDFCSSLISLPDISKWNLKNAEDLSYMFYNCSSLVQLPDISKWNIESVKNMSYMFYNCSSLVQLPDISKWNLKNAEDLSYMFYNCSSLIKLPNISKWNLKNVYGIGGIFDGCYSLVLVENLKEWDNKVKRVFYKLFGYNESLFSLLNFKFSFKEKIGFDGEFYTVWDIFD